MARKKIGIIILLILSLCMLFVHILNLYNEHNYSNDENSYSTRVGESDDTHWWNNTGEILQINSREKSIILRVIKANDYIECDTEWILDCSKPQISISDLKYCKTSWGALARTKLLV